MIIISNDLIIGNLVTCVLSFTNLKNDKQDKAEYDLDFSDTKYLLTCYVYWCNVYVLDGKKTGEARGQENLKKNSDEDEKASEEESTEKLKVKNSNSEKGNCQKNGVVVSNVKIF